MPQKKRIELFDHSDIEKIQWPTSEDAIQAQQLPLNLLKQGVHKLIPNIQTDYYFLKIDDSILPLTVNNTEYQNSYLTSNYYMVKEMRNKKPQIMKPLVACVAAVMKAVQVNRTVIVNNWLLSNSLYPDLTDEQIELITSFLERRFPKHMIMLRGINKADGTKLLSQLKKLNYHTFFSRQIFYYRPNEKSKRSKYHRRRDEKALQESGYTTEESQNYERLIQLYSYIYKDKHTIYCPHYTPAYLELAVKTGFMKLCCLKSAGKEIGVFGYCTKNGVMIVPFFGYDAQYKDVYRILTMLILKKAEELGVSLNDGSGGEQTKKFRGMKPFDEYAAIYTKHLPLGRKLFWQIAGLFSNSC